MIQSYRLVPSHPGANRAIAYVHDNSRRTILVNIESANHLSMLQSPKKKIQRPRRLNSVSENPIFEAKQDNRRHQFPLQRRPPHGLALCPTPPRQREGHRGHRRHYSVPDVMMLQSASLRQINNHAYPAKNLGDFGIGLNCGQDQQHLVTMDDNFNNFCLLKLQRPRTPPNQHVAGKSIPKITHNLSLAQMPARIPSGNAADSI